MPTARAYSCTSATTPLAPTTIERREPTPRDVQIEILFCGICHSDLHAARSEWQSFPTTYPCVPGHEIVGRVTRVGGEVTRFAPGEIVAVGCLVDSDGSCPECRAGFEQFCFNQVPTYGGRDRHSGGVTYGGYSESVVVDERFVLRVPPNLDLAGAAPLVCAGITTWSPLRHWKAGPGRRVGVVGLGGLGHMAVKLAHALGAEVTVFTTSARKAEDARRLGADDVVVSGDATAMQRQALRYDLVIDTVSAPHDINQYLQLLKRDGNLTLVGVPTQPLAVQPLSLIWGRRSFSGSLIGGIAETQEMLDFCGKHGITADIEVIGMQQVNEAYERLARADVKYRFVIDMASLKR